MNIASPLMPEIRVIENTLLYVMECNQNVFCNREGYAFSLRFLADRTGLHRDVVRGVCRSLADQGLAFYMKGLWTEDGMPAGSGYGITNAGAKRLDTILGVTA